MKEQYILLLVREKRFDEAIAKYIDDSKFDEAEEFCATHAQKDGLLTKLLEKYFQKFQEAWEQGAGDPAMRSEANFYRNQAITLMKQHASTGLLDPHAVLNSIPNDWTL